MTIALCDLIFKILTTQSNLWTYEICSKLSD